MITESSILRDIGFIVGSALDRAGVTAVLSGGGAATIWAPDAIQSEDLDFILTMHRATASAQEALAALGFERDNDEYRHPVTKYFLEFPPGPLSIGDELITSWSTLEQGELCVHVLSPTDSCRDRLAAFYPWNDRSSLTAALAIARAQSSRMDFYCIPKRSEKEGSLEKYLEFERRSQSGGSAQP